MKLTILALTTLLTLSTAQMLGNEPACATACLSSAISKAGCAEADQGCQCGPTQASISAIVASCLLSSCPATQLIAVQSIGLALCAQYSAGLTMTTTAAPATVTSTAGGSGSSSSSLPMGNGPVATSTSTTVAASTTVMSTTTAPTTSAAVLTSASAAAGNATVKSAGSATTSGAATVSSSAAMALLVNGIGGLAALFFGVAATL